MFTVKHRFQSAKADGTDNTLVKPTNWNDTHRLETDATSGMVIGRDTSGPGELQELPMGYNPAGGGQWIMGGTGGFNVPSGTTSERPGAPPPGSIRFNTTTNQLEVWIGTAWQNFVIGSGVPVGTILPFGGNTVPAGGYFLCDGARLSRASWPALYGAIGLLWDTINDGSTFALPYLIGRSLVMADYGGSVLGYAVGVGGRFGTAAYNLYIGEAQLPSHRHVHTRDDNGAPQGFEIGSNGGAGVTGGGNAMQYAGWTSTWSGFVGSGNPLGINPVQPSAACYMVIKY